MKRGRPSASQHDYDHWREVVAEFLNSDLSVVEYCRENEITVTTFYRWVKRLKNET